MNNICRNLNGLIVTGTILTSAGNISANDEFFDNFPAMCSEATMQAPLPGHVLRLGFIAGTPFGWSFLFPERGNQNLLQRALLLENVGLIGQDPEQYLSDQIKFRTPAGHFIVADVFVGDPNIEPIVTCVSSPIPLAQYQPSFYGPNYNWLDSASFGRWLGFRRYGKWNWHRYWNFDRVRSKFSTYWRHEGYAKFNKYRRYRKYDRYRRDDDRGFRRDGDRFRRDDDRGFRRDDGDRRFRWDDDRGFRRDDGDRRFRRDDDRGFRRDDGDRRFRRDDDRGFRRDDGNRRFRRDDDRDFRQNDDRDDDRGFRQDDGERRFRRDDIKIRPSDDGRQKRGVDTGRIGIRFPDSTRRPVTEGRWRKSPTRENLNMPGFGSRKRVSADSSMRRRGFSTKTISPRSAASRRSGPARFSRPDIDKLKD